MLVLQGVVTAAASLITSLAQKSPEEFRTSVSLAVARLSRVGVVHLFVLQGNQRQHPFLLTKCPLSSVQIVTSASIDLQDYTYYFVAAPWLSVKLLRLLQCYPPPGTCHIFTGKYKTLTLNKQPLLELSRVGHIFIIYINICLSGVSCNSTDDEVVITGLWLQRMRR